MGKGVPGLKCFRICSPLALSFEIKKSVFWGTDKNGMDIAYAPPIFTQREAKWSTYFHEWLNTLLSILKNFLVKLFLSCAFKDKQIVTNSV